MASIAPTYVGMDAHKDSISLAILRPGSDVVDEERIANTPEAVRSLVRRWRQPKTIRACYEAGPTGYELQRQLSALGVDCVVIAPALVPRRPGDRVKTDRRDARKLARLLRAGELTTVRVPSVQAEAVRDLLRLREDLGEDILRARHRLSKLLLRHGRSFPNSQWTKAHHEWIRAQCFDLPLLAQLRDEHLAAIEMRLAQRDLLERQLLEIARSEPYTCSVARLAALRGIREISALTLLIETGDFRRFGSAPQYMGFTGLVPSESSSGERRRQGAITKTGNAHLRRILVEAAWSYRSRPSRSTEKSRERLAGQPAEVVGVALASEQRLHQRYWHIVHKGKLTNIAVVAVARELAGVIWALMRTEPAV